MSLTPGDHVRWHCYTSAYESVFNSTVDAGSADQAAEMAAREHGIAGEWTVVLIDEKRGVTRVKVEERHVFEAVSAESGPE